MTIIIQRNILLVFVIITVLSACKQAWLSNENIRPSPTTNEFVRSNISLAIAYMKEGKYEESLDKLNRAKQSDPRYSPIYNVFGVLYQQLGQFDKAEESYKRAISLDSNDSPSLNNYGQFLCQRNRIKEAEKIFLKAVANPLYENPEIAITNAGLCLDNNGQLDKAEKYYRQALQRNPEIPQALLKMSKISFNSNDYLSARGYLQRYQAVSQYTPESLWLGVRIEQKLGNKDQVSSYVLFLKNSFPDSSEAMELRESGIQ